MKRGLDDDWFGGMVDGGKEPLSQRKPVIAAGLMLALTAFTLVFFVDHKPTAQVLHPTAVHEPDAAVGHRPVPVVALPQGCTRIIIEGTTLWRCGNVDYRSSGSGYEVVTIK